MRNSGMKRMLGAAFLLVLILAQWVLGFWYIRAMTVVDSTQAMSAREEVISDRILEEHGFKPVVRLSDAHDMSFLGYGAPFIFSQVVEGVEHQFSFDERGPQVTIVEDFTRGEDRDMQAKDTRQSLLERLFCQYYPEESPCCIPAMEEARTTGNFHCHNLPDLNYREIISPPPRVS